MTQGPGRHAMLMRKCIGAHLAFTDWTWLATMRQAAKSLLPNHHSPCNAALCVTTLLAIGSLFYSIAQSPVPLHQVHFWRPEPSQQSQSAGFFFCRHAFCSSLRRLREVTGILEDDVLVELPTLAQAAWSHFAACWGLHIAETLATTRHCPSHSYRKLALPLLTSLAVSAEETSTRVAG